MPLIIDSSENMKTIRREKIEESKHNPAIFKVSVGNKRTKCSIDVKF